MPQPSDLRDAAALLTLAAETWATERTALANAIAERDELRVRVEQLTIERDAARSALAVMTADRDVQKARADALQTQLDTARADLAEAVAEIQRLRDIIDPPPTQVRVLDSYGMPGGGGFNFGEKIAGKPFVKLPPMWWGTDVGQGVLFDSDSWEGKKWNLGLDGKRHMASGTIDPKTGELIVHGGTVGTNEGVYVLDVLAQDFNGPLPGALFVHSQNSFGEDPAVKPDGWHFGYGSWEQRSVGRLTWRRADGQLVCGQFGFAADGKSGVAITSTTGTKRVITGTETWACRAVQRITDDVYYVSVEKQRVSWSARPTPGGLWRVDVASGSVARLLNYPDTPEHSDNRAGVFAVACRNAGIFRDGIDITFNLPRASEWYALEQHVNGDLLVGCMNPVKGSDGRFWSVAWLKQGASAWVNITPPDTGAPLPTLNSADPFEAVNKGNTLGRSGATVNDVLWRGDIPCASASGIVWGYDPAVGYLRPAPGNWIIVHNAYDRTPDGYEAFATSDFRAIARKPGGVWKKVPFSGDNDGTDVSWVGHKLHFTNGTRQVWDADTGAVGTTSGTMPPKNPQAAMTDETKQAILQSLDVQQFGARTGTWALDAETLLVYGHGASVSKMEDVQIISP